MGDGGAFHFRAEAVEGVCDIVLLLRCADELVAADDAAFMDAYSGGGFFAGGDSCCAHGGIRGEVPEAVRCSHLRDDAGGVAEDGDVHVVVHGVLGDNDVTDVDAVIKGAGDAGVDQVGDAEDVDQDLGADGRVYFSDTALDDDDVSMAELSDVEFHAGLFSDFCRRHLFSGQFFDFKVHSADNADFHIVDGNLLLYLADKILTW